MVIFGILTGLLRAFVEVVAQHLNHALVIGNIRFRANVKNGNPSVSTARWRLMPLVHL